MTQVLQNAGEFTTSTLGKATSGLSGLAGGGGKDAGKNVSSAQQQQAVDTPTDETVRFDASAGDRAAEIARQEKKKVDDAGADLAPQEEEEGEGEEREESVDGTLHEQASGIVTPSGLAEGGEKQQQQQQDEETAQEDESKGDQPTEESRGQESADGTKSAKDGEGEPTVETDGEKQAEEGQDTADEEAPKDERTPEQAIEDYKAEQQRQQDEEEKAKRAESDEAAAKTKAEEDEQAKKDAELANQISDLVDNCVDRIKPVLKLIKEHLDKADRDKKNDELDEDKVIDTVKPLVEQATSMLQECYGGIKGLDPSGKLAKRAQARSSERKATPEEYRLADLLKQLSENVTKTVDDAKRRLDDMPKAKKNLGPLLDLLQDPLFQILSAVGLLLNGVLGLLGNLLGGLGLGGIVNGLLGGLGLDKILNNLGLGKLLPK